MGVVRLDWDDRARCPDTLIRVVRDRTRQGDPVYEVIQASAVVMFVVVTQGHVPMAPDLHWRVSLEFGRDHHPKIFALGARIEDAFAGAVATAKSRKPRGRIPLLTPDEWALIVDGLRDAGAFDE